MEVKKTRTRRDTLVGDAPDLLPFAWRTPPVLPQPCSKFLRDASAAAAKRTAPPPSK